MERQVLENIVGETILVALEDMESGDSERANLSLMLHFVVFDTQRAVFDLVVHKHLGAAFALLRVLFESNVKAEWLNRCATNKQLVQFKKDGVKSQVKPKKNITFQEMVDQLEKVKPHLNGKLKEFKNYHWKGLNSFTHSGVMQLRQFVDGPEEFIKSLDTKAKTIIDFSNRFAIASLGGTGSILQSEKILKAYLELAESTLGINSI